MSLKKFRKALKINTNDPEIYYLLGNVYFNEKNYDEAIKYYTKAIELDSTYAQAYTSRGKYIGCIIKEMNGAQILPKHIS